MADISISVPDNADAFAKSLAAFVLECDKAVKDGWQVGQDVPAILAAVLSDLVPAAAGFAGAKDDFLKDPFGSLVALAAELKKVL